MADLGRIRWRTVQAWADKPDGTGFTLTPSSTKLFTSFFITEKDDSYVPVVGDFSTWVRQVPQDVTVSKTLGVTTVTVQAYDPDDPDIVVTINDALGFDSVESTWATEWQFDKNEHFNEPMAGNITITTGGAPLSNVRIAWKMAYTSGTLTLPSEFKKRTGSVDPGSLAGGNTYLMVVVSYNFGGSPVFIYEITQI